MAVDALALTVGEGEIRGLIGPNGSGKTTTVNLLSGLYRADAGEISLRGERWDATAEDPPIEEGAPVIVTAADGLKLRVKRDPASIKLLPAAGPAPDRA